MAGSKIQLRSKSMKIDILQQQRLQTKVSFLIVDSKVSFVEEPSKSYQNNALTLTTYSNSDSAVITYISIFEELWAQTELKIRYAIILWHVILIFPAYTEISSRFRAQNRQSDYSIMMNQKCFLVYRSQK